jgi:hypothetical protein
LVAAECSLSSTDTQLALKRECHSKTTVRLKECSPKSSGSISRVSVADLLSVTQNWCRHVAQYCHSSQTKQNMKSKERSCKNTACSQHSVMWHTDAVGLQKCDLGHPSHLLSPRQFHLTGHPESKDRLVIKNE